MSDDVVFNIYYGGKFETLKDGDVVYNGGCGHELLTPARSFFDELPFSLYGQRLWYKLPYEEMRELKILYEGNENFKRMCLTSKWIKVVEIYIERDEEYERVNVDQMEERRTVQNVEGINDAEGRDSSFDEGIDVTNGEERDKDREDGREEDHVCEEEARDKDREDGIDENHVCEEEAQVEDLVATFVDEEENEDYQRTPLRSDFEGTKNRRCAYDRWRRGSGELKIRQVFESVKEFRDAVLEYALQGGWNVRFNRWGSVKSEALCGVEKCKWRVYCSYEKSEAQWMIKKMQEDHTCYKDGRCKILSQQVICDMFINDLRNDPVLKPIEMQKRIHERYNVAPTHEQCRKAKKKALELIEEEFNEQYARMKDYRDELKVTNPQSTVEVRTNVNEHGKEVFDSFYMCFAGLRDTWKDLCRPIFGIDGCFLKSNVKGQLLAAVGRDGNNQIYPFAWAVVQVENSESWLWFIRHLKHDLGLRNGHGFTVISDRQKGLLKAVNEELPHIEHRMCARHIYGNMKSVYPKKPEMKSLFWGVVDSFNEADYEKNLAKMKEYDLGVYEAFMSRNPKNYSRAFFKTTSCCEDALNNFSESYNNTLEKARAMPLIQSLETMRRQAMVRIALRRKKNQKHKGKHSLKVGLMIAEEDKEVKNLRTVPGRPGSFEVIERGQGYKVDMKEKTCKCRRWDMTGIPCRHALRVVFDNPRTYNREELVSDWYLTTTWRQQYIESIGPVNGMKFWSKNGQTRLEAPPREVQKGRRRNPQSRMKAIHESPTKGKKVTNHGRTTHCYRCGNPGHNSRKCSNSGVPNKPRPPKKSKTNHPSTEVAESQDLGTWEGPTPTQHSQPDLGESSQPR